MEWYRGNSIDIGTWGGSYAYAQRQSYYLPFQIKFQIDIKEIGPFVPSYPGGLRDNIAVYSTSTKFAQQASSRESLQELTPAIHNGYLSGFPEITRTPWTGGGGAIWSTGIAYNLNAIDGLWRGDRPTSWGDFWDANRFPGKR